MNSSQSLYKPVYRNRSHLRMDFTEFTKSVNNYLQKTLPTHLKFRVVLRDHFYDRLMDREADTRHIKKLIFDAVKKNLCEILYFSELKEKDSNRMVFTDTINHVFTSFDTDNRLLVIRTYFHNPNRKTAIAIPEFLVHPFQNRIADEFTLK